MSGPLWADDLEPFFNTEVRVVTTAGTYRGVLRRWNGTKVTLSTTDQSPGITLDVVTILHVEPWAAVNPEGAASRVLAGLRVFAEEMQAQGVHLGISAGSSTGAFCVVDAETWPCSTQRANTRQRLLTELGEAVERVSAEINQARRQVAADVLHREQTVDLRSSLIAAQREMRTVLQKLDLMTKEDTSDG